MFKLESDVDIFPTVLVTIGVIGVVLLSIAIIISDVEKQAPEIGATYNYYYIESIYSNCN